MNTNNLKQDFPFFKENKNIIYLDNAASTQKPNKVINKINNFIKKDYSNIHRGIYKKSEIATESYENTRSIIANFFSVSNNNVILNNGATEGFNTICFGLKNYLKKEDIIILSEIEHHANLVPWLKLKEEIGFTIKYLKYKNGELDFTILENIDPNNIKIISLSKVSNVIGIENDFSDIFIRFKNAIKIIDASQSVPHNIKEFKDTDILIFSGHKIYSPSGTGAIICSDRVISILEPILYGGDMIKEVSFSKFKLNDFPSCFEAGTPNIEGIIGLGEGINFFQKNYKNISQDLYRKLYLEFNDINEFIPVSDFSTKNIGIYSFYTRNINILDLAYYLSMKNICFRIGHHCAMPLHKEVLNIDASLRFSFGMYNDENDLDFLIETIKKSRKIIGF